MARDNTSAVSSFEELNLESALLKAVTDSGYSSPTPIQEKVIPHVLAGQDVTGIAQTGTGKTAAFVLPLIQRLSKGRARARMPRCIIIAPTRELASQVAENFAQYGKYKSLTLSLLIGGVSLKDQEHLLIRGVDVLIATPGRLIDQFERGKILLTGVEHLVLDEADRMLDMGFIPDIEKICRLLPPRRQTLLFSATMPPEIARLAKTFQKSPIQVEVARPSETADTIKQRFVKVRQDDIKTRIRTIKELFESRDVTNAIVFCNRKREVDLVAQALSKSKINASAIHGDMHQTVRTETLQKFRDGKIKYLIASDVAARGLDIPEVSHVFNLAPPNNDDDYVHRIGRTGRAGRTGESYTIVGPEDHKSWSSIVTHIKVDIVEIKLPNQMKVPSTNKPKTAVIRGRERRHIDRAVRESDVVKSGDSQTGFGDNVPAFILQK